MKLDRKENSYQGYHGVGKHDGGGSFGNYSNYQHKRGRDWKKIAIIAAVVMVIISFIGLLAQNSGGTGVSVRQSSIEAILKSQSSISLFIEEYEEDLSDDNVIVLSAHVDAVARSSRKTIADYYKGTFSAARNSSGSISKESIKTMSDAADFGNYDAVYQEELLRKIEVIQTGIGTLYNQSDELPNQKAALESAFDNFELLDRLY